MKKAVFVLVFLAVMVPLAWVLFYKYEGKAPQADISLPSNYLKKSYEMNLTVRDQGIGLRRVMVSLMQNGNEKVLLDKTYPPSSILSLFSDMKKNTDSFKIPVESRKYGMNDGDAVIRILILDYSWHGWNKGNQFYEERQVVIDTKPPQIRVLSQQHNVTKGGTGLVLYRINEENIKSGVMVGEHFFPGYPGIVKDTAVFASFFALDHHQGPGTRIFVKATDPAGNVSKRGFHHYISDKNFKTDVLNISDRFLERKVPDIDIGPEKEQSLSTGKHSLLNKFLYVNKVLREKNVNTVLAVPQDTVGQLMWEGRFVRLAAAANRAGFADRRIYKHRGREIDRAVHMGVDLASTSNAKVAAANGGRVIMTRDVGIFGNTVIIDHGFGLASLYAHLSDIRVQEGDEVSKGDIIGNTGLTGLAGGDHLHFSMIVNNVFVNPLEWWDSTWIKHNITSKIAAVENQAN
ncbi:MAG: M23 family metallopeptidase [Desulfobacter sp.]|nr:MAG: M23 family metallopeptidase [Desulfobacter sp.]